MGLLDTLVLGALTLIFGLGGLLFATRTVREFVEAVRVVTGPEGLPDGDGEQATYLAVEVADDPDLDAVTLGQVRDTFGYWLVRYWATGARTNGVALLGRVLLSVVYGPDDYRREDDRRRGGAVDPTTVPVRVDGRLLDLDLGADAVPFQRLEADGGTVPFLAGAGTVAVGLLLLLSPMVALFVFAAPVVGLAAGGFVLLVPAGLVTGKVYHDTGLFGRWTRVTTLDDDGVPAAVTEAGAAPDPASTARVDLATAAPGDRLGVVGTVESTAEGLRVVDGVVSTRGRWFLAVAATVDAVRTAVFAAVSLLLAAVGVVLLAPGLVGFG